MELSAWFVIVPFCFASLLTGIVQAVGTKWGLFKHYWIIIKLFLTVTCTVLLLLQMRPISYLAGLAEDSSFINAQHSREIINLIAKAGMGLLVLVAITTISVYKPWGKIQMISNGNKQFVQIENSVTTTKKLSTLYALIGLVALILTFIIIHLLRGGLHGH